MTISSIISRLNVGSKLNGYLKTLSSIQTIARMIIRDSSDNFFLVAVFQNFDWAVPVILVFELLGLIRDKGLGFERSKTIYMFLIELLCSLKGARFTLLYQESP